MAEPNIDTPFVGRKTRDQACVLPLIGLVLLLPPMASIFQLDTRILGVPFTLLYLFAAWGLLIIGAAWLARRLNRDQEFAGQSNDELGD